MNVDKIFVPVAEIDLKEHPNGQVEFQMRREGSKITIFMAITPTPEQDVTFE